MNAPPREDYEALLATAHRLADRAGAVILPHFRTGFAIDHKGGDLFDPVTVADRDAEAAIRAGLAEAYPHHGILGEEFGALNPDAEYCWVIDPIDGTRSFVIGLPIWGTLIGLTRDGVPLLGLMDQPFTGERFIGGHGGVLFSSWRRGAAYAGACLRIAQRCAARHDQHGFLHERGRASLASTSSAASVRLRRFGGDCYNYCMLALGQIDLVVEAGLNPYDIQPLIPIIEQAGGIVTTWEGDDARAGGRVIAAGDRRVHAAAMKILSS